jgi:hypothetical protein
MKTGLERGSSARRVDFSIEMNRLIQIQMEGCVG